jgi:hypothetical protein
MSSKLRNHAMLGTRTESLLGTGLVAVAATVALGAVGLRLWGASAAPSVAAAPPDAGPALAPSKEGNGRRLFVDAKATGAAGQDGSEARPFATIQQAADVAQAGDTVYVKAGVYRETVTPKNSGTAAAPITFRPYMRDVVTISGAERVTGWAPDAGKVYKAPLPGDFYKSAVHYSDQVFVDGRMVHLARWPNYGPDISRPAKAESTKFVSKNRDTATNWTTATFEDEKLEPKSDGYYDGAEIVVQPNHDAWAWTVGGTVVSQKGKTLTLRTRNDAGKDGNGKVYDDRSRYFLFNKRELLDAPGEWFHDAKAGTLYLEAPAADDPSKHVVEARKRDYGFNLDGKSHVTVKGFRLFACTVTTDVTAGYGDEWDEKGNDRYPWRGKGTTAAANHIVLDGLDVQYPSHFSDLSGHFFLQWGQNTGLIVSGSDCVVQNCRVRYSAGNGITLLGRRNRAVNNLIEDVAYMPIDASGINTGGAADSFDHDIGYNTIRRTGRSGITPRNLRNSDLKDLVARVHHNDISHCMLQDFDGGAIYAGGDGTFVRLDHNWCHDISGFTASGVYPDILTNWVVDHNVTWNLEWGIHLQNNGVPEGNALCYNNTLLVKNTSGVPYGPFGFANSANQGKGDVLRNNIIACQNPAESKGYKPFADNFKEAEIGDNLLWDSVPGSATDPKFKNMAGWDLALSAGSPAIDKGQIIPAYTRNGVTVPAYNDPVVGKAPDLGAYEFGVPAWRAGCTLPAAGPSVAPPAARRAQAARPARRK